MEDLEEIVSKFRDDLVKVKKIITQSKVINVSKSETLDNLGQIARFWFKTIHPRLLKVGIDKAILDKYAENFSGLLTYSNKPSKSSSILTRLNGVLTGYHEDIVLPVLTLSVDKERSDLSKIVDQIKDPDENEYLLEAISCVESGYLRAAIILGWCATINRVHHVIEKVGFSKFSAMTEDMKKMTTGRYKRFSKSYQVSSMSELQEVFDSDTLLIIEALGLIDNNQNARLVGCYNLRCNCGHPGKAPITKYNAMSFFSDIIEIVLNNEVFEL